MDSQDVQDISERIAWAYDAFFAHLKEHRSGRKAPPKFRKRKNYHSFTLKQAGYKFLEENRVQIMGRTYQCVNHRLGQIFQNRTSVQVGQKLKITSQ